MAPKQPYGGKKATCSGCGEPIWHGRGSLPDGQATCRPCRKVRREAEQLERPKRHCRFCNVAIEAPALVWCVICRPKHSKKNRKSPSAERGYGTAHRNERAKRLKAFADGDECARCGGPMYRTQPLDLDHTDDRTGYLGLSHAWCNRATNRRAA